MATLRRRHPTNFRRAPWISAAALALVLAAAAAAACAPPRADVAYTAWASCGMGDGAGNEASRCLCTGVKACDAVQGGSWLPLGSEQFRVCGVKDGACVIAAFTEVEGGGQASLCRVPLDADTCDETLGYGDVAAWCEPRYGCNLLFGTCPAGVLACE